MLVAVISFDSSSSPIAHCALCRLSHAFLGLSKRQRAKRQPQWFDLLNDVLKQSTRVYAEIVEFSCGVRVSSCLRRFSRSFLVHVCVDTCLLTSSSQLCQAFCCLSRSCCHRQDHRPRQACEGPPRLVHDSVLWS